jgi:hypothetical protein
MPTGHPINGRTRYSKPYYEGQWLWASGLVGILSTMETHSSKTVNQNELSYWPSVLMKKQAVSAARLTLPPRFEKNFGRDSIAMVMDEGGMGVKTFGEILYVIPEVAEKATWTYSSR